MQRNGSQYYDKEEFFHHYTLKRASKENPNDTIEKPIFIDLVGDVSQLNILDLGCGDGKFGIDLMNAGCKSYSGVEGSFNMHHTAVKNLQTYKNITLVNSTIENWDFPTNHFDLVISRLVIHYIQDIDALFKRIYDSLTDDGRLIFSIEHPVITSTLQTNGQRTNWLVDNYFVSGIREQEWLGSTVYKYHRTIEDYFQALKSAGFKIESLRESLPKREHFEKEETYLRRLRIPLFLFLAATK